MSKTCGDLGDGKPCEFFRKLNCPMVVEHTQNNLLTATDQFIRIQPACAPMVALVDARKSTFELSLISQLRFDLTTMQAEAARWKRAAERMGVHWWCPYSKEWCENMCNGIPTSNMEEVNRNKKEKCCACRLAWALGEEKP
jgi:hypothetical protein